MGVRYEITRVFQHVGAPLADYQVPEGLDLTNYDVLWNHLKLLPELREKSFPVKSEKEAWAACLKDFRSGSKGVQMSAGFHFPKTRKDGPLFGFLLQPLRIDNTHRLGRRFGNDRFLEIAIPHLSGLKLPENELKEAGDAGRVVVIEWLVGGVHELFGRTWKPFFYKDSRSRRAVPDAPMTEDDETTSNYKIVMFAVSGADIVLGSTHTLPQKDEPVSAHTALTVEKMINWLVPLEVNKDKTFLKLFSRISLGEWLCLLLSCYSSRRQVPVANLCAGLSKTVATVELLPSQIKHITHDLVSRTGEVMNDGCGRLSRKMAMKVAQMLGLTHVPSAFQARIGSAKGVWIVDDSIENYQTDIWIETYPSQRKWERTAVKPGSIAPWLVDSDHRTFEVLTWSDTRKPATLNLQFLPLLEDRSTTPGAMRGAIAQLLKIGLEHEMSKLKGAMEDSRLFRKWLRENASSAQDRLKSGVVTYHAGLPESNEEKLNLLLDAGFNPKEQKFVREHAKKCFTNKANTLKERLNITVGQSTYALMVVDFSNLLEPDEIHLGFSSTFTDEVSGFSETMLDGMDVLVARSPAHFISDIQKVKAVYKPALKGLKDVVVFSSKGDSPLAAKLSGGDYDGDTCWICWDPTIVASFQTAEVPPMPNLFKRGDLTQDKTTYQDLMSHGLDPFSDFLIRSLDFNLRQSYLGMVTVYKEELCYTKNDVQGGFAILLSTLLSSLVDAPKQGYVFTQDKFEALKSNLGTRLRKPAYKEECWTGRGTPLHIIDYLKFTIAKVTIEELLTDFHRSIPESKISDTDVPAMAVWFRAMGKLHPEIEVVRQELKADIESVYTQWRNHWGRKQYEAALADPNAGETSGKNGFMVAVSGWHEQYLAIQPKRQSMATDLLLEAWRDGGDFSMWSMLKASVAFSRHMHSPFVFWMAGRQIAALKAAPRGAVCVSDCMYAMLKPDATFVKRIVKSDAGDGAIGLRGWVDEDGVLEDAEEMDE